MWWCSLDHLLLTVWRAIRSGERVNTATVALISVGGTLGGALLALIGTLITQYVTERREVKRRQHEMVEQRREERLAAYRKFYAALHSADFFLVERPVVDVSPEFRAQVLRDLWTARSELELIASPAVRNAAVDMHNTFASRSDSYGPQRHEKEDAFREAVRKDIGQPPYD
jgi:hypothetical protein